ncbi:MAG: GntR family transcriptional regulator [Sphingomonadaceae bacterium]
MTEQVFPSLHQNTLRVSVLNVIRESILNGTLKPGHQLVQAEIAAQMQISRAPIREALRQLEEEGLVESVPYRGTFVSRITRRDIRELYSLRGALEGLAVRLVIARSNERVSTELEGILAEMWAAAEVGDYPALSAADLRFHTQLCLLSDHQRLIGSWKVNSNLIRRILSFRNRLNPATVVAEEHVPIVRAIRDRDEAAARRAIEDHCVDSGEALASTWPDDED